MRSLASLPVMASIASWALVGLFLLAATSGSSWGGMSAVAVGIVAVGLEVYLLRRRLADARGQN